MDRPLDYRDVTNRTPSPTQSEAKVLSDKTRSCNCKEMKKLFDPEWLKQPRNQCILTRFLRFPPMSLANGAYSVSLRLTLPARPHAPENEPLL